MMLSLTRWSCEGLAGGYSGDLCNKQKRKYTVRKPSVEAVSFCIIIKDIEKQDCNFDSDHITETRRFQGCD